MFFIEFSAWCYYNELGTIFIEYIELWTLFTLLFVLDQTARQLHYLLGGSNFTNIAAKYGEQCAFHFANSDKTMSFFL